MGEPGYITNNCQYCGGGIEFPDHGVGAEIECPHCARLIRLVGPTDTKAPTPCVTEPSPGTRLSPAELLLLSKFLSPSYIGSLGSFEPWNAVLEAHPSVVINGFLGAGLLEKVAPDLVFLLCSESSSNLKSLAKERSLPMSGTKPVLARRLAKADPEGIARLFRDRMYLSCTPTGRGLAEEFLEAGVKAEQQARDRSLAALQQHQLEEACRVVASFEASRVFGRGLGINWQKYDPSRDSEVLHLIFSQRLVRHEQFDGRALDNIRVAAAMMHLWGTNNPKPYLEKSLNYDEVDWEVETRMLLSRALGIVHLQEIKSAGIQRVRVLGSGSVGDCQVCRSDSEVVYPVAQAPVLPHVGCCCPNGCRCILVAEI